MKFTINDQEQRVLIDITETAGQQQELLAAFQDCQAGTCTCPTQEYTKVESMKVKPGADEIHLTLNLKPGEKIETSDISDCLQYTEQQIQSKA